MCGGGVGGLGGRAYEGRGDVTFRTVAGLVRRGLLRATGGLGAVEGEAQLGQDAGSGERHCTPSPPGMNGPQLSQLSAPSTK